MESKLNLAAIQDYSNDLAENFISELDSSNSDFDGKELLNLNEVKQVNLFIIRDIFSSWMEQMEANKSKYFDYDNEKVLEAKKSYMNSLSHHIKVDKKDLQGLYSEAINDTILFYLVPDFYLIHFIKQVPETLLTYEFLKQMEKYIDLNRSLYNEFLSKIADLDEPFDKQVLSEIIHGINFEAEEKEIFDFFSKHKTMEIEQFLNIDESEEIKAEEEPKKSKSFEFENEKLVHEKFKNEQQSLNEKHEGSKNPSLADNFQNQKINNIAKSISLNQKFVFVKELFNGNLDNFEKSLNQLDSFDSWEEANEFIEEKIAPEYNWDISKDSVADFTSIVERRYR